MFKIVAVCATLIAALTAASSAVTTHDDGLVPYRVVGDGIPTTLTDVPGDPKAGEADIVDRKLGNCLSCHSMPIKAPDQGTVGPSLAGVGSAMTVPQLRLRIVNPKLINPDTIMPAYYRVDGLHDVLKTFAGKPILTAQQVEDVVAFLATLK